MHPDQLAALLLAALATIFLVTSVGGLVATRLRQPAVVGEMFAGVLLGPCALGALPGHPVALLFTPEVRTVIGGLAQVGLVAYVFGVAREFDLADARRHARSGVTVAVAALVVPLTVGGLTGWGLAASGLLGGRQLVLGTAIAFAVTAMPVLARMIDDLGLARSRPGVISLSAAALGDAVIWGLLVAVLTATGTGSGPGLGLRLAGLAGIAAVSAFVVKPLLALALGATTAPLPVAARAAIVIVSLFACAAATTAIGLHAVFGAVLCGILAPRSGLRDQGGVPAQRDVTDSIATVGQLLLPVFFVTTGLAMTAPEGGVTSGIGRTLGLVVVLAVLASASKVLPCAAAARMSGLSRSDSWAVGLLMNTRGLTELVVISILAAAGLIDPVAYTVLVGVTVVATVATPALLRERRTTSHSPSVPAVAPAAPALSVAAGAPPT